MYEVLEYQTILAEISQYAHFSLSSELILATQVNYKRLIIERDNAWLNEAMVCERMVGSCPMAGMRDLRLVFQQIDKLQILAIQDLIDVASFIRGVSLIQKYFKDLPNPISALSDLVTSLEIDLKHAVAIEKCFSTNGDVLDTASANLKQIRRQIRLTQDRMQSTVNAFIQKNSQYLSEQIFTYRNDRVVVLVKNSDKHHFGGMLHGESQSGQTAYLEPPILVELNNTSQALIDAEQEEIKHICQELTILLKTKVSLYESDLMTIALLDGIFAKAHFGWVHEGCVATISTDEKLVLKDARHPLIDPKQVVSNTYQLDQTHRTLLITGPNTGGKTVSLKIIGLFTLLAYSGIPLPCDNASIPLFDQIFVDIGDEQSIQHSLSTFSAHLSKLANICDHASQKSLILLDELGAGTDPVEGESLAMAILNYLRQLKAMVVATTHYSKLKNYGLEHSDIIIASMQFNVETMQPSYHFIEGLPGQSYAIEIARRFGLKPSIITDAQNYKNTAKTAVEELAEKLEKSIHSYQDLQNTLLIQQKDLDQKTDLVNKELDLLTSTKDKRYSEVEQEVQAYYEEKQIEADEILAELRATSKQAPIHESIAKRKRLDQDHQPKANATSALSQVELGQWVKIITTNQIGQVVQIKQKKIGVYSNGIRMEVSLDKLRKAEATPSRSHITVQSEIIKQVSLECNVIGLTVEEACAIVDKHIDDCLRAHMPFTRIIHGHGTGALRTGIHAYLKNNSHIESYRLGAQSEGGVGATVVHFKR